MKPLPDIVTRPDLTLPAVPAAVLHERYAEAPVILEYGSGGSTALAAECPGQVVFSVESDRAWADNMVAWASAEPRARTVEIHHVDIGPTAKWGMPVGNASWQLYHHYPISVWDRPDFVHPDLVLVDGRFREACFLTTMFRISRPTPLLWDDYGDRDYYREVERLAAPVAMHGRMAEFLLTPTAIDPALLGWIMTMFSQKR